MERARIRSRAGASHGAAWGGPVASRPPYTLTMPPAAAVFAATALNRGISLILSPDQAYDAVPGLDRLDPADPDALERLTA